ncbi:hypothetical protein WJX82_011440 [Trebouxia sp. C0006]
MNRCASVLSPDGKYLLVAAASSVRVYSSVTAEIVHSLYGHTQEVTAIVLHHGSNDLVYTASMDGAVKHWNFMSGQLLKSMTVGDPVVSMVIPVGSNFAYLQCDWQAEQAGKMLFLDVTLGTLARYSLKLHFPSKFVVSQSGRFVATFFQHTVFVYSTERPAMAPLKLYHTRVFTCVAFDPTEERIAAGDVSGRILIWNSFKDKQVAVTTVHWHAHPVGCLCFSADGTLLLSGGEEAVLVIWQVDSGARSYLPRLGGGLHSITRSPLDSACYVVSQADNTVRTVNTATMKVLVSVHGMRPPPRSVSEMQSSSAAVLAGAAGHLVLPAHNSLLQFWDAARDCHVHRLQVAARNTVSLTQQDHELQGGVFGVPLEPHVSHVAFSHEGSVMATVDVRPNAGSLGSDEQSLRFWDRREGGVQVNPNQEQPFYSTNTYLDDPHRGGTITSLAYHPSRHMAATTSSNGDFKIWVRQEERRAGSGAHWRCQSVGNHTGAAMCAAAFSSDGSMMGVASQDEVTLWDPYTNSMLTSLASPPGNQGCPIVKLLFVPNTPFLAGYTTGPAASLIVWNLLTESIWWSYALTCSALAVDPESSCIAVAVAPQKAVAEGQKGSQKAGAVGHKGSHEGQPAPRTSADAGSNTAEMLQGPMTVPDPEGKQASMGSSAVFLFVPSSGQPQLSWSLGQATVASLLFALPGTKLHSVSLDIAPAGTSPLLVLTEDRQYAIARMK